MTKIIFADCVPPSWHQSLVALVQLSVLPQLEKWRVVSKLVRVRLYPGGTSIGGVLYPPNTAVEIRCVGRTPSGGKMFLAGKTSVGVWEAQTINLVTPAQQHPQTRRR